MEEAFFVAVRGRANGNVESVSHFVKHARRILDGLREFFENALRRVAFDKVNDEPVVVQPHTHGQRWITNKLSVAPSKKRFDHLPRTAKHKQIFRVWQKRMPEIQK